MYRRIVLLLLFSAALISPATARAPHIYTSLSSRYTAPYLGLVATRGRVADSEFSPLNFPANYQTYHYLRDNVQKIAVCWFNGWIDSDGTEHSGAGSITGFTASVGTLSGASEPFTYTLSTRLTFGGSNSTTILANGLPFCSDLVTFYGHTGEKIAVRSWLNATSDVIYISACGSSGQCIDKTNGDASDDTTGTDLTGGGSYSIESSGNGGFVPVAIIAMTRRPSIEFNGDSRTTGFQDSYADYGTNQPGDLGELARSLGPHFAYTMVARPSSGIINFLTSHTFRAAMAKYVTHYVSNLGAADLNGSNTSTVLADIVQSYQYFQGNRLNGIFQVTTSPVTTSTDNWTTIANQTPIAESPASEVYNTAWRNNLGQTRGIFDPTRFSESSLGSQLWTVLASAVACTPDGEHENANCNSLLAKQTELINYRAIIRQAPR